MKSGSEQWKVRPIDETGLMERIARMKTRSIKGELKERALKLSLGMIDLTTLEGKDTDGKVRQMCYKALHMCDDLADVPAVAAVCVYPTHVRTARKALEGSGVKVASVATGFPSGNTSTKIKKHEVKFCVDEGADEIDMVISRGRYLSGNYNFVFDEIAGIKQCCGGAKLKVILETGELSSAEDIRRASMIAIGAGADFIKTSTGKVSPAATMPVTYIMLEAIRDHYFETGNIVGMKPAGGISTSKVALQYLVMVHEVLGEKWLHKNHFRFGASSLANDIVLQLRKQAHGNYQDKAHISID